MQANNVTNSFPKQRIITKENLRNLHYLWLYVGYCIHWFHLVVWMMLAVLSTSTYKPTRGSTGYRGLSKYLRERESEAKTWRHLSLLSNPYWRFWFSDSPRLYMPPRHKSVCASISSRRGGGFPALYVLPTMPHDDDLHHTPIS
jgi:hypothetical protein